MKTVRKKYRLLLVMILWLIIGIVSGFVFAKISSAQQYQMLANAAGAFLSVQPDGEEKFMEAMKGSDTKDSGAGEELMKKYGYAPDSYVVYNIVVTSFFFLIFIGIVLGALFLMVQRRERMQEQRIADLAVYLENVNQGRETVLSRCEDEFSQLEDEIYKTVIELRQTKEDACKENKILADNLADISHQLKTPITSMSLMTQLLAEGGNEDCIKRLERQIERMDDLVTNLLTLSKIDAKTLKMEKQKLDAAELLILAAEPVEFMIEEKNQKLLLQSDPRAEVFADRRWMAEALLNIIKNCSEHTPKGGSITASYIQNPLYTEFVLEDNGPGLLPEDIPHLFQRFYRGNGASKDSIGIGLALSKSLLEQQNGMIRAENRMEGGARFIVKLYT